MKKQFLYWSIPLLLVGIMVFGLGFSDKNAASISNLNKIPSLKLPAPGNEVPNFSIDTSTMDTSEVVSSAPIYKLKNIKYTSDYANELGLKLKLNGKAEIDRFNRSLVIKDGLKYLVLDNETGKIKYFDESKKGIDPRVLSKNIPSDKDAAKMAEEFLRELNLMPSDFRLVDVASITITPGTGNPESSDAIIVGKKVFFYKNINNEDVLGVSRITVTLGSNGEVIDFGKHYRDSVKDVAYPLKTVSEAINDIKSRNNVLFDVDEEAKDVIIKKAEIRYYEDPGYEQPYMQPVFLFSGQANVKGQTKPFIAIVPAIHSNYIAPVIN